MLTSVQEIKQIDGKSALSAITGGFNVNTKAKVNLNSTKRLFDKLSNLLNYSFRCSISKSKVTFENAQKITKNRD